ncbi:hypothetical protein ABZU75_14145 [Streptosporangium sp. NPDC005286]
MLPGADRFAQLCVDAFGYGPRTVRSPYGTEGGPGVGAEAP